MFSKLNHLTDFICDALRYKMVVEFVRFQTALDKLLHLERDIARKQSISTLTNIYVYKRKTNK